MAQIKCGFRARFFSISFSFHQNKLATATNGIKKERKEKSTNDGIKIDDCSIVEKTKAKTIFRKPKSMEWRETETKKINRRLGYFSSTIFNDRDAECEQVSFSRMRTYRSRLAT